MSKVPGKHWRNLILSLLAICLLLSLSSAGGVLATEDNVPPVISGVSISGRTYEEDMAINDNTPTIKVQILDPGYPENGVGVTRENIVVRLAYDNNTVIATLENNAPWDPAEGYFENTYDNDLQGLNQGTYQVWVSARDNAGNLTEGYIMRFIIDITRPSAPASLIGGVEPEWPEVTMEKTMSLTGTAEANATIKVYLSTDNGVTWTENPSAQTTVDSYGNWTTTVSLIEEIITGIKLTATDVAGNESSPTVWGYLLLYGASAPAVTIASPMTGTSTENSSITVTGSVSKDNWESYTNLTVTVQVGGSAPESVELDDNGNFTCSVALSKPTNTITITTTDVAGNTSSDTITVNYTPSAAPPAYDNIILIGIAAVIVVALIVAYMLRHLK